MDDPKETGTLVEVEGQEDDGRGGVEDPGLKILLNWEP